MNKKAIQWLYGELPRLVEHGILTPDAEARLRTRYGPVEPARASSWCWRITGTTSPVRCARGFRSCRSCWRRARAAWTASMTFKLRSPMAFTKPHSNVDIFAVSHFFAPHLQRAHDGRTQRLARYCQPWRVAKP